MKAMKVKIFLILKAFLAIRILFYLPTYLLKFPNINIDFDVRIYGPLYPHKSIQIELYHRKHYEMFRKDRQEFSIVFWEKNQSTDVSYFLSKFCVICTIVQALKNTKCFTYVTKNASKKFSHCSYQ